MKATWEDTIIAESDKTVVVEGNHYFPPCFSFGITRLGSSTRRSMSGRQSAHAPRPLWRPPGVAGPSWAG